VLQICLWVLLIIFMIFLSEIVLLNDYGTFIRKDRGDLSSYL